MPPTRRSVRTTAGAVLGAAALAVLNVAPAHADNGTIGVRETVCAQDLYVRVAPDDGAWMGTLYRGQTFLVEARDGNYVYGFAYGYVNRRGWVQDGRFC